MSRLEALKQQFAAKTTSNSDDSWKKYYPFWKMQEGQTAVVRFLSDADETNPYGFLIENHTHELYINGEKRIVPCAKMFGHSCPICEQSKKFYDEKNEDLGKKYYRKISYIGQVIVIESPIEHDAEQLVKLIEIGPKIYKLIQAAFQSGDLENDPDALKGGYNFRIKKSKSGQYFNYDTSSFAPKQSDVDDDVIEKLDLYVLKDQLRKELSRAELESLLHADMTGTEIKASTENSNTPDEDVPNFPSNTQTSVDDTPAPVVNPASSGLAALRAKAAAKAAAAKAEA